MTYPVWPSTSVLKPWTLWWRLSSVSRRGESASGLNSFILRDGGGKWLCDMTLNNLTAERIKAARALLDGLDGGVNPVLVPVWEEGFAPYPLGAPAEDVPYSDGSSHSDGSLIGSSAISATLQAASLRATSVSLNVGTMAPLMGGERFAVKTATQSWRVHTIITVGALSGGVQPITIRPPLRDDLAADTVAEFDRPMLLMRCTNCKEALSALRRPVRADLTVKFEEAFDDVAA